MNLAPIFSIIVSENRQRKDFDPGKLMELGDSIQKKEIGLLHPIVVRRQGDALHLVAGERRLRVFKDSNELGVTCWHAGKPIPFGQIPYIDIGELSPLDAWEAELEENIKRTDLSWQERARATSALMELREKQAVLAGKPHPLTADISLEVRDSATGRAYNETRAELLVANHLDDPDVFAAPTAEKALKVLKRKEDVRKNHALATEIGKTMTSAVHTLVNADAREYVTTVPDEAFDVILTDPPYGMDADDFGDSGGMAEGGHGYADSAEIFESIMGWFPEESFRVTKPQAHAYVFCDLDWFQFLRARMEKAGWRVFRTPLIWHKPAGFRAPWPEHGPQRRYETCLYAIKGDRKTQKLAGDVMAHSPDDNLGNAAQKPVALFQDLLSRSIIPGDQILDLFCGSGPIFPAAHALKCRATGVEMDPSQYAIASRRIKELS